jgi:hypothetical protein
MIPRKSVPLEKLQSSRPAHPGNSQLIEPAPQKIDKLRWWLRSARISGCWLLILPTSPYQWTFTMGPCTAQKHVGFKTHMALLLNSISLLPFLHIHFHTFVYWQVIKWSWSNSQACSGGHHGSPVNDSLPGKEVQLEALSIAQVAELQHRLSDGAAITASHAMSPMKIHRKG